MEVLGSNIPVSNVNGGDIMRGCFGTIEFCSTSGMCKGCEDYVECKKAAPKRRPILSGTVKSMRKKMESLKKQENS